MTDSVYAQKVAAQPESVALRAEYAQHLFQMGDLRGSISQVQAGLALPRRPGEEQSFSALMNLERLLLGKNLRRLVGSLSGLIPEGQKPHFEDGKLVEVVVQVSSGTVALLEKALSSGKSLGTVEVLGLIVDDVGDEVLRLLSAAALPSLVELNFWARGPLSELAVHGLTASSLGQGLEVLYLRGDRISDRMVMACAQASPRLMELRLRSQERSVTLEAAYALADAQGLSGLVTLGLMGTCFGDRGALALATSKALAGLRRLDLRDGMLTNEGARILSAGSALRQLESLDVAWNQIDDAGLAELRRWGIEVRADYQHQRP